MKNFFISILIAFFFCCCLAVSYSFGSISAEEDETFAIYFHPLENFHSVKKIVSHRSPFDDVIRKLELDTFAERSQDSSSNHFVQLINTGEEALIARLHLIRNAQKNILIQTYIWRHDECGLLVLKELMDAADRGVQIRILIDKLGADDDPHLTAFILDKHPNIKIKYYNPSTKSISPSALHIAGEITFNFKKFNQRMHNKIMVFDDQIAITGGRNFENDYFDYGRVRNFKDRDLLVIGKIVKDMTDSFAQYWAFKLSFDARDFPEIEKSFKTKKYEKYISENRFAFNDLFEDIFLKVDDNIFIKKQFINNGFYVKNIRFMSDDPGKNLSLWLNGGSRVADELFTILSGAKKELVFQSPYLVFDGYLLRAIRMIRRQNPDLDIRISTNSLAAADHITAYAHAFKQKRMFVQQLKLRIFEFRPVPNDVLLLLPNYDKPQDFFPEEPTSMVGNLLDELPFSGKKRFLCIHAKSFVIDDETAWVGSFNLDPRSVHLNTEVGVVIKDRLFTRALKENMLRDMAPGNSWTLAPRDGIPVISFMNSVVQSVMEKLPIGDAWPFRYTSLFQLKKGHEEVPYTHVNFYKNYKDVSSFPEIGMKPKQIQLRLIKAIIGLVKPVI